MIYPDIIEPIKKPTDWINGLVIVEKPNGKLHICLDPWPLNNAMKHKYLNLSTAEEIFPQMSGSCFFSKLDASLGYWQIKVDKESSHPLTFGTTLGRYHFKRLPYRIHSLSKVFQWGITSIISDVPGSANSQDDIIVWGRTLAEHNEILSKVFLKIHRSGLKLNKKKCQIGVKSILFLGHIIYEGIKVDPAKFEAITKMPLPNSVNELRQFLSMITYLGKFIPNLHIKCKIEKPQLDAIGKLKLLVTTTPCLKIFNLNLQTYLKIDASSEGLGALLEQNHRTLT